MCGPVCTDTADIPGPMMPNLAFTGDVVELKMTGCVFCGRAAQAVADEKVKSIGPRARYYARVAVRTEVPTLTVDSVCPKNSVAWH